MPVTVNLETLRRIPLFQQFERIGISANCRGDPAAHIMRPASM